VRIRDGKEVAFECIARDLFGKGTNMQQFTNLLLYVSGDGKQVGRIR